MTIDERVDEPEETPAPASRWTAVWRSLARGAGVGAAVLVGVLIGRSGTNADVVEADATEEQEHAHAEIWTCAMHPQIRMDAPGQCPICGMDLVLAKEGDDEERAGAAPRVTLSPGARALAGVKTVAVVRTEPRTEVRLLGRVDYDETRLRMVTPWTDGRIDRLKVRVTGSTIRKGQVVAMLYSPEVYAAMRDLVVAAKQAERLSKGMHGSGVIAAAAVNSARERLRLLGISEKEIKSIEKTRSAPKLVPVRSNFSGTVLDRKVEEGDYVKAGTALYHVADLSRVWVQIDAYESDLPHLRIGQTVVVEIDSLPDETFVGRIAFIDPVIDKKTRTARVRVEVTNAERQLRPGMFAQAVVEADIGDRRSHLVVPVTAALFTGRRSVVYVAVPGEVGVYELREVRLGPRAGPVFPVLAGVSGGEEVVAEGAFVIDADLQLAGGRSMMTRSDDRERDSSPVFAVTAPMLAALEPVLGAYLSAHEQLAADDLDGARDSLKAMAKAANEVELPAPRNVREAWASVASRLAGHGRHAATAKEDGEVRTAFEHASAQVIRALRTLGNPTRTPLSVAFCPMAFDRRGAQWVQAATTVANPYYGDAMLRCGEFELTVEPGERLAPLGPDSFPADAPTAGHQH